MKNWKWTTALLGALLLVSCGGGGGNSGTSPFGDGNSFGANATADLIVTLSSAQLANTGSATVTVTVTAIDANHNTLANVPVTVAADNGAVVSVSGTSSATDTSGQLVATLGVGSDKSNRVINVTATSGAVSKATTVQVVGTAISSTMVPAVLAPSTAGQVQYRVVDKAGNPMSGVPVQITATGLNPAQQTGTTGASGDFNFNYTSPAGSGNFQIVANIGGATDTQTLQVQAVNAVQSVTTAINSASVSASPNVVGVNLAGSSANRSEIRALFLGANNLPIPNVRVRFDLNGDPLSVGGTFTTGTQLLYSDANGVVTAAYVPGTLQSPTNGVTVRACYGTSDNDPNLTNCTTSARTTLTVTSAPLGVSIGTNETIIVNDLTYVKQFIVSVVDSAGVAKPDVNLSVSLDLPNYRKGAYAVAGSAWVKTGSLPSGDAALCANEDTNRNGVLESLPTPEDFNGNGRLDPGKSDVSVSLLQTKTGADGTAVLQIQYAKSFASWVDALITVSASGVSGTEGRATYLLAPVPVDAAAIKKTDSAPAFITSPYGLVAPCSVPN